MNFVGDFLRLNSRDVLIGVLFRPEFRGPTSVGLIQLLLRPVPMFVVDLGFHDSVGHPGGGWWWREQRLQGNRS